MQYSEGEKRSKKTNTGRLLVLRQVKQWVKASTPVKRLAGKTPSLSAHCHRLKCSRRFYSLELHRLCIISATASWQPRCYSQNTLKTTGNYCTLFCSVLDCRYITEMHVATVGKLLRLGRFQTIHKINKFFLVEIHTWNRMISFHANTQISYRINVHVYIVKPIAGRGKFNFQQVAQLEDKNCKATV